MTVFRGRCRPAAILTDEPPVFKTSRNPWSEIIQCRRLVQVSEHDSKVCLDERMVALIETAGQLLAEATWFMNLLIRQIQWVPAGSIFLRRRAPLVMEQGV